MSPRASEPIEPRLASGVKTMVPVASGTPRHITLPCTGVRGDGPVSQPVTPNISPAPSAIRTHEMNPNMQDAPSSLTRRHKPADDHNTAEETGLDQPKSRGPTGDGSA